MDTGVGSDLYEVEVLEKQDRTVTLRLEVIHPDSNYLSDNLGFALMILLEVVEREAGAPLAAEVSFDDALDPGWLECYARGFIEDARFSVESGSVAAESSQDWIRGRLTVAVTDPAWIAHLRPGAQFDSRAFDAVGDFAACAPIHPGQVDPGAPVPEGFMSVPGALWENCELPAAVRAPAYSASGYRALDLREGTFSAADLADLDGEVVVYQGEYDNALGVGILSLDAESVRIFRVGDGYFGWSSNAPFTGRIGRAELVAGKRLGSRLRLSRLLGYLRPIVRDATVAGDSAIFRIAVPPGNTSLATLNEGQLIGGALQLLLIPLLTGDGVAAELDPSPLSWTVEREVRRLYPAEERQLSEYVDGEMRPAGDTIPPGVAQRLARGFIAKSEVVARPPAAGEVDIDSLTEAQQREWLERPWPELVLRVTPYHAEHLRQLRRPFTPAPLPYLAEAYDWEGAPAEPAKERDFWVARQNY
jgi:hypothetical protein